LGESFFKFLNCKSPETTKWEEAFSVDVQQEGLKPGRNHHPEHKIQIRQKT
jgi:hypothetical protein